MVQSNFNSIQASNDFKLLIIGHWDSEVSYYNPYPENHTGGITYAPALPYTALVFRLVYTGNESIKVLNIQIWQDFRFADYIWNWTDPITINGPNYNLTNTKSFEFGISNRTFDSSGYAKIYGYLTYYTSHGLANTLVSGEKGSNFTEFETWPLIRKPSLTFLMFNIFVVLLLTIIRKKRKRIVTG